MFLEIYPKIIILFLCLTIISCVQPPDDEVKELIKKQIYAIQKNGGIHDVLGIKGIVHADDSENSENPNLKIDKIEIVKRGESERGIIVQVQITGTAHVYDTEKVIPFKEIDKGNQKFSIKVPTYFNKDAYGEWFCRIGYQ